VNKKFCLFTFLFYFCITKRIKKMIKTTLEVFVWFIALMIVWSFSAKLISSPSDISCLIGILTLVIYLVLSFKTKCFTKINFKRKNEEKN